MNEAVANEMNNNPARPFALTVKTFVRAHISTLPKFTAVGIFGVLLGTALLWYLTDVVHLFYLLSSAVGAAVAILSDFILNNLWTFSGRKANQMSAGFAAKRLAKYAASKAVGFGISISVLALLTQFGGLHYLVSNVFAIAASFTWNYTLSKYWVWASAR